MKKIPNILLAGAAGLLIAGSAIGSDFYWNPTFSTGDPSAMGGDGLWSASSPGFWNGSANVGDAQVGDAVTNVYFNKAGTITKQDISQLTTGTTYNFYFAAGTTNITASNSGALAGIQTGDASTYLNVNTGSVLNFSGNGSTSLRIGSGKSVSESDNLVFRGGGTVNFNSGSYIGPYNGNSKSVIEGGTTVNFNTGSGFYGVGGDASNPYNTQMGRLFVNNGVLNVNGGDLYLGKGAGTDNRRTLGLGIGMAAGSNTAVVNLNSGTITTLGSSANGQKTNRNAGVTFAGSTDAASGGTLNLYGGTLITTNIRANANTAKALLNIDGGTIAITTDEVPGGTALTDADIQWRLDQFIYGFRGDENSRVVIGSNGATFDTSRITAGTTRMATIRNSVYGEGNLTKTGANALLLSGTHYYTGRTIIEGGTLAVGNLDGNDNGGSIQRSSMILVKTGAVFDTTRRATTYSVGMSASSRQVLTNEGSGKVVGNINAYYGIIKPNGTFIIEGSMSSLEDQSIFKFDNLGTDIISLTGSLELANGVSLDLSDASLTLGETYNLFLADSITYGDISVTGAGSSYRFDFGVNTVGIQQALQMTVTAIPEPSTYAFIMGLGVVAFLIYRRRK